MCILVIASQALFSSTSHYGHGLMNKVQQGRIEQNVSSAACINQTLGQSM